MGVLNPALAVEAVVFKDPLVARPIRPAVNAGPVSLPALVDKAQTSLLLCIVERLLHRNESFLVGRFFEVIEERVRLERGGHFCRLYCNRISGSQRLVDAELAQWKHSSAVCPKCKKAALVSSSVGTVAVWHTADPVAIVFGELVVAHDSLAITLVALPTPLISDAKRWTCEEPVALPEVIGELTLVAISILERKDTRTLSLSRGILVT